MNIHAIAIILFLLAGCGVLKDESASDSAKAKPDDENGVGDLQGDDGGGDAPDDDGASDDAGTDSGTTDGQGEDGGPEVDPKTVPTDAKWFWSVEAAGSSVTSYEVCTYNAPILCYSCSLPECKETDCVSPKAEGDPRTFENSCAAQEGDPSGTASWRFDDTVKACVKVGACKAEDCHATRSTCLAENAAQTPVSEQTCSFGWKAVGNNPDCVEDTGSCESDRVNGFETQAQCKASIGE